MNTSDMSTKETVAAQEVPPTPEEVCARCGNGELYENKEGTIKRQKGADACYCKSKMCGGRKVTAISGEVWNANHPRDQEPKATIEVQPVETLEKVEPEPVVDDGIPRMHIGEFQAMGLLQELNRQFLHPLGLALETTTDDAGNVTFSGVQDYRDDDEGMLFGVAGMDEQEVVQFINRINRVKVFTDEQHEKRVAKLGWVIEPVGTEIG